jgi:hypothetical protein
MKRFVFNGLLFTISLTIALAFAEIALRFTLKAEQLRYGWDPAYWIAKHKEARCSQSFDGDLEFDDRRGWRMRRNYTNGGATHDENGYRKSGMDSARTSSRPIIALGDSFTYGLGVPDESTYISILGRAIGSSVVNMGANAYGIDQAIITWEQEGRALNPRAVILGYFYDDLHRAAVQLREFPKPSFSFTQQGELQLQPVPNCNELIARASEWRLPVLAAWSWGKIRDRFLGGPTALLEERRALGHALLRRLKESIDASGAQLIVLLIPHCQHPNDGGYADWIISKTAADCKEIGLACIDFREDFNRALYGPNCHWSIAGHQHAASRIADTLAKLGDK